jgi:alkylation response protein AidB-like acyl-CoA dehydrogenase
VTAELGNERSGPERILSTFPVLAAWAATGPADPVARADLGRLTARLACLRQLSMAVAAELNRGGNPATEAALVKDLGTRFEGEIVDTVSRHVSPADDDLGRLLRQATLHVPAFTLRGGTTEVLRGIVAKGLTSREQPARAQADDHRGELAAAVSSVLGRDRDDWAALDQLGFTRLTVPEELGGSGGDLRDAAVVVAEAARCGSSLPLAEALFLCDPLLSVPASGLSPAAWAELLGAAARVVQIGGAARAVLELAVTHTGDRVQFGRPLSRFQAVQQLLARLAADTATVTIAADVAVRALSGGLEADSRGVELLVAAAKAESSALALEIARAGHQLHGAIGFTEEHALGGYTRRLWSWRQESGNELYWQRRIASLIGDASGDLWPLLTSTTTSMKGCTA